MTVSKTARLLLAALLCAPAARVEASIAAALARPAGNEVIAFVQAPGFGEVLGATSARRHRGQCSQVIAAHHVLGADRKPPASR